MIDQGRLPQQKPGGECQQADGNDTSQQELTCCRRWREGVGRTIGNRINHDYPHSEDEATPSNLERQSETG